MEPTNHIVKKNDSRAYQIAKKFGQDLLAGNSSALLSLAVALGSMIPVAGGALLLAVAVYSFASAYKTYTELDVVAHPPKNAQGELLQGEELEHFKRSKKLELYRKLLQGSVSLFLGVANFAMAPLGPAAPIGMGILNVSLIAIVASSSSLLTLLFPENIAPIEPHQASKEMEQPSVAPQVKPSFKQRFVNFFKQVFVQASVSRRLSRLMAIASILAALPVIGAVVYVASALFSTFKALETTWQRPPSGVTDQQRAEFYQNQRAKAQEYLYMALTSSIFAVSNIHMALQATPMAALLNIAIAGVFAVGTASIFAFEQVQKRLPVPDPQTPTFPERVKSLVNTVANKFSDALQNVQTMAYNIVSGLSVSQVGAGVVAAIPIAGAALYALTAMRFAGGAAIDVFRPHKVADIPNKLILAGASLSLGIANILLAGQLSNLALLAQAAIGVAYTATARARGFLGRQPMMAAAPAAADEKPAFYDQPRSAPKVECVGCHKKVAEPDVRFVNFEDKRPSKGPLCLACAESVLGGLKEKAQISHLRAV